jgi:hypothetical protein
MNESMSRTKKKFRGKTGKGQTVALDIYRNPTQWAGVLAAVSITFQRTFIKARNIDHVVVAGADVYDPPVAYYESGAYKNQSRRISGIGNPCRGSPWLSRSRSKLILWKYIFTLLQQETLPRGEWDDWSENKRHSHNGKSWKPC